MTRRRTTAGVAVALAAGALLATGACTSPGAGDDASPSGSTSVPTTGTPGPTGTSSPSDPSTSTPSPSTPSPAAGPSVRFSALGDIGSTDEADAVLSSIADRRDDFTLALGDLSYGDDGEEEQWCRFVARRVGSTYPFQLVSGNHEEDGPDGDIDRFVRCLPNRLPGIVGEYGREWYVDQPAVEPLVRVVMISPSLDFGDGKWSYDSGTTHHAWVRDAVTGARAAGVPWVVVGMHKPCLTIGRYDCAPGADITNLLVESGVDLVLTGHEHLYQRTRPVALGPGCPEIRPGRFTPACVVEGRGTTFVTVGTGGTGLRDVRPSDAEQRYFAAVSGRNLRPSYGSLDIVVTADRLTATFVPVAGGRFTDGVVLTR